MVNEKIKDIKNIIETMVCDFNLNHNSDAIISFDQEKLDGLDEDSCDYGFELMFDCFNKDNKLLANVELSLSFDRYDDEEEEKYIEQHGVLFFPEPNKDNGWYADLTTGEVVLNRMVIAQRVKFEETREKTPVPPGDSDIVFAVYCFALRLNIDVKGIVEF